MEAATLVVVEPTLKYHPHRLCVLTEGRDPAPGPCEVGSLTGAVSSQKVTEERYRYPQRGWKSRNERKGKRVLDCETDTSSRCESRS